MSPRVRHGLALLAMVAGSAAVLGVLIVMNELTGPPEPEAPDKTTSFEVEERRQRKPPDPEPEPRRENPVQSARRAPAPNISTALSGLSFDLPQLESARAFGETELLAGAGGGEKLVMTEDAVDSLPAPRSREAPEYPREARERGVEGQVVLKLKISDRGAVERVRVVDAEPPGVFDEVAVAAAREWTFEPATYEGQPVSLWVTQPMPFRLN